MSTQPRRVSAFDRMIHIFYAGLHYDTQRCGLWSMPRDLPDGAYYHIPDRDEWYRSDHTPVLLDDVPKELRLWALILT